MYNSSVLFFVGLGAAYDILYRRIPNWLVVLAVGVGLALSFLRDGWWSVMDSVFGLLLGLVVGFFPFAMGFVGAGDVKFVAAMGTFLGVMVVPRMLFYTVLLGGVLALLSVAVGASDSQLGQFLKNAWIDFKLLVVSRGKVLPQGVAKRRSTIPFGVAVAGGVLLALYGDPEGRWAGF